MTKIAIVTMAYNERVNLPIWLRHYTSHCPGATLFVIDHGTDDGSTRELSGVSVIPLPRTAFDDQTRVELVADIQHGLLRYYDIVIYTDCDEMLIADPRIHTSLTSFLADVRSEVIAPVGVNVHHIVGSEPPIDLTNPILGQRRFVRFAVSNCKPTIARVPLSWVPGFHWCDRMPDYRMDLFQFHLKRMDMALSLERLRLTRSMEWSERALRSDWASDQRVNDEQRIHLEFSGPASEVRANLVAPFDFEKEVRRHHDSLRPRGGFIAGDFFRGPMTLIPDAFFGLI
jgi:hypothetical protein